MVLPKEFPSRRRIRVFRKYPDINLFLTKDKSVCADIKANLFHCSELMFLKYLLLWKMCCLGHKITENWYMLLYYPVLQDTRAG